MFKKRLFITGIPTAGKSYLAKKLAEQVGGICVSIDNLRIELSKDLRYERCVSFYSNQDERSYYSNTVQTCSGKIW